MDAVPVRTRSDDAAIDDVRAKVRHLQCCRHVPHRFLHAVDLGTALHQNRAGLDDDI